MPPVRSKKHGFDSFHSTDLVRDDLRSSTSIQKAQST